MNNLYPYWKLLHHIKKGTAWLAVSFCTLVFGAHGGEQEHIADRRRIGQQHHQPVQAEAQAAGGGKAVFQCGDIVFVHLGIGSRAPGPFWLLPGAQTAPSGRWGH